MMTIRYTVRATEHGYGVWDAAIHGWRSERSLSRTDAEEQATALAARDQPGTGQPGSEADDTPRPADLRAVDPPRPVEIFADGAWWPGQLDRWARQPDGWYGRATRQATGKPAWYPSAHLRPVPDAPADTGGRVGR